MTPKTDVFGLTSCCSSWRSGTRQSRRAQQSPRTPSISIDYIFMSKSEGASWRLQKTRHGRTLRVYWALGPHQVPPTPSANTIPRTCCRLNAISTAEALTRSRSSIKLKPGPRKRPRKLHQCHHQDHPIHKIHSQLLVLAALRWMVTAMVTLQTQDKSTMHRGPHPRLMHPLHIQVTRGREVTSILNSTTEDLNTISNILLAAVFQGIGPCTHPMVQRVTGHITNLLVVPRELPLELQDPTPTTGIRPRATSPGPATPKLPPPARARPSPDPRRRVGNITARIRRQEDIQTSPRTSNLIHHLVNKGHMVGPTTPSIEASIHHKEAHNRTPSNGINLPDLVPHQLIKLVLASGRNHLTSPLKIHSSRGAPTCLLQDRAPPCGPLWVPTRSIGQMASPGRPCLVRPLVSRCHPNHHNHPYKCLRAL